MKKIYVLLAILALLLTACGTNTQPTVAVDTVQEATAIADIVAATHTAQAPVATETASAASAITLSTDYENSVAVPMQLMIGILKLEDTELAITSTQAESFISLLTFLQDLSTNTSATQEQIDSLVEQVQSILTEEQITAIANMHITQDTVMELMRQQGMTRGELPQRNGNPPPQGDMPQGTPPAGRPGGEPPAGGMQLNESFAPPPLIDMLIQLMESKTTAS